MNPLVEKIYKKHVDRILKSEEFYAEYNQNSPNHRDVNAPLTVDEKRAFAASVLEVAKKLNIRARVKGDFNKKLGES